MADFCTHWFRLAHDALQQGGRAGLVGTNMIRKNESREASLDYIIRRGGKITEAVSTQVWSGDAQVHVSLVNWLKGDEKGKKRLLTQHGDRVESPWTIEELETINSQLTSKVDVSGAKILAANCNPKVCFTGQNPANPGFFLDIEEAMQLLRRNATYRDVVVPYMTGDDLIDLSGPSRWIVDFGQKDQFQARFYDEPFQILKSRVMPDVLSKAEREKSARGEDNTRWTRMAKRWWQFRDFMPGTMAAVHSVPRYIACSIVMKRPIFEFVSQQLHPDHKLNIFAFADDYSFGIIQGMPHWEWTKARGGTLTARIAYTGKTIFDTFPWPQTPTKGQIAEVASAAVALRTLRREIMTKLGYSLRALYRTLEEPGANPLRDAHARLDTAVRAAYAMPKDADTLAFLLALNLTLANKEKAGERITPPGLQIPESERDAFVTDDCIRLSEGTRA